MKPDYEGFCKHVEEWEINNVAYSKKDLYELSKKYNCKPCDEECQFFRWGECDTKHSIIPPKSSTMEDFGVCDKPEKYER